MLKYLVILLDGKSASFCHYDVKREAQLISEETLREGILFAMKENLTIQFVYPDYELPEAHKALVESIDHTKIKPIGCAEDAGVVICNGQAELDLNILPKDGVCVLRTDKTELFGKSLDLKAVLKKVSRLNLVIKDVDKFKEEDFEAYKRLLSEWSKTIKELYTEGVSPQLNVLTDRMVLDAMNNCNAGDESLTLAPDGKFYVCPAFYQEELFDVGSLADGLNIKNKQLYKLDYAPICRKCDAYQCKRCTWLNLKTTQEVNTPSHEQCVVAHLERNASRQLLEDVRSLGEFLPQKEIKEIDYLDPFDKIEK